MRLILALLLALMSAHVQATLLSFQYSSGTAIGSISDVEIGDVNPITKAYWQSQSDNGGSGIGGIGLVPIVEGVKATLHINQPGYVDLTFSFSALSELSRIAFDFNLINESGIDWGFSFGDLTLIRLTATDPVIYGSASAARVIDPADVNLTASSDEGGLSNDVTHSWSNTILTAGDDRWLSFLLAFPAGEYDATLRTDIIPNEHIGSVPEPSTLALTGISLVLLVFTKGYHNIQQKAA